MLTTQGAAHAVMQRASHIVMVQFFTFITDIKQRQYFNEKFFT